MGDGGHPQIKMSTGRQEVNMKISKFASIATFVFVIGLVALQGIPAQADLHIGKWKLNLGKSKSTSGQAPKSETQTYEQQGNVVKVAVEGLDADGNPIAYGYAIYDDGRGAPITGYAASGADTVEVKRIDANTTETVFKKAGKPVGATRSAVSKDGKVLTVTSLDADGHPTGNVLVFDKQ
jgi:hypothetical protein